MLECVVNISEGVDTQRIARLRSACEDQLLDVHSDRHHHRSVFTLAGPAVFEAVQQLARAAVDIIDIREHSGAHPRIGAVDVVPFVPLAGASIDEAIEQRDLFAHWLDKELAVPSFFYGPERTLPEIRKHAFRELMPDVGPRRPHMTGGATAIGARPLLVAYNLWLANTDLQRAKAVARSIRQPELRALGLQVGEHVQVSCNLVAPHRLGPLTAYDLVAQRVEIERAELVGLIPRFVLDMTPQTRWQQLDLSEEKTIEARIASGLNSGEEHSA